MPASFRVPLLVVFACVGVALLAVSVTNGLWWAAVSALCLLGVVAINAWDLRRTPPCSPHR